MSHIDFWFDFISPYAYFGWLRISEIAQRHGATLRPRPVLFAALLDHHGQLGPAEIPSKREHTFKDIIRYATLHNLKFSGPATHPFNPITALRCALPEASGTDQHAVIDALFEASWGEGADVANPEVIREILDNKGLPGSSIVENTKDPAVKACLKRDVEFAIERGVFGVPTCEVDGELFWGNDRLTYVELRLEGRDPLPDGAVERLLAIPTGAVRPGARRQ